jgi:tubulin polyglutamylase TTLL6/13
MDEALSDMTMHLTNYAINKNELNYVQNKNAEMDSVGHKRSVKYTLKFLDRTHGKDKDFLMDQIKELIVKTLICAQPHLKSEFELLQHEDYENSMCFHILGFDVMLDHKCKPFLLEVNHSPSFTTDTKLDEKVKGTVIRDALQIIGLTKKRKQKHKQNAEAFDEIKRRTGKTPQLSEKQREEFREEFEKIRHEFELSKLGPDNSFEMIFPSDDPTLQQKYSTILETATKVYQNAKTEEKISVFQKIRSNKSLVNPQPQHVHKPTKAATGTVKK